MELKKGNQLLIAAKKLDGKAHSNPGLLPTAEPVSSVVQLNAASIFVDTIPANSVLPVSFPANYTLFSASLGTKPIVELVEFQLERLAEGNYAASVIAAAGTDVSANALAIAETSDSSIARDHAYLLKLPTDYSSAASNPKKGTAPYVNNTNFSGSGFGLQLIPPAYGARYTAKVFKDATEIAANDESNWVLDYGAGLLFIQDKAGALTTIDAPTTVRAYLYIGDYAAATIAALSASLQSVAGTNAYATMSVGGVAVIANNTTGNLTIASGNFGGVATTNDNLLISASAANDTITFSLRDNLSITSMTASNGYLLTNSNNGRQYSTNGGTTASLNTLTFRDTDTTSDVTQSIGRIAFESFDTDTSGSNNSQVVRAFIEAVSEDTTPDAFLAFGTAVSGALAQERMRVTNSGVSVTGGISASGNLTVTGNSTIGGNLIVTGSTTLGDGAADTASINAGRVNISNLTAASSELAVLVTGSQGQLFTRQLAASAFSGGSGISGTLIADRVPFADGTNSLTSSANMTFVTDTLTVNSSTFGQSVSVNQNLTVGGNATITGDLTVNGETTIINTTTLSIEDKFIVLGRSLGSQAPASEGGIIVEGAAGSGAAFVFNSGSGGPNGLANRWGVALGVPTGSMNVTPTDFMVTVSQSSAAPSDANAPTFGSSSFGFGNMHIQDNGEIWIYS